MSGQRVRHHLARLRRFVRTPVTDQLLVGRAFVLLGYHQLRIRRRGLRSIQDTLGTRLADSTSEIAPADVEYARRVAHAIGGARLYTPWSSDCFPQALTAHHLLKRNGVSSTIYFGATKHLNAGTAAVTGEQGGEFAAHAWVRAGNTFVTGGDIKDAYTPVVWFGQPT